MEIFGIEFESWNVVLLRLNWFAIILLFVIIFVVSSFCLTFENIDLISIFTAVAATFNNIGPGLEMVGPTANYGHFSDFSKYVMIFDMLAGRLELFPLLMLFHPELWKETINRKLKNDN